MAKRKDDKNRVLKDGEGIKRYKDREDSYYYRWVDETGKRKYIYAKTLHELREKEAEIQKRMEAGMKNPGNLTVNDMYDLWVQIKRGLKDNTFQNYKYMYVTFTQPTLGTRLIKTLTKTEIRKYYIHLVEERHLKVRTVETIHIVLFQVLQLAFEEGYIKMNYASNAIGDLKKTVNHDNDKKLALTIEEQRLFEKCLEEKDNIAYKPIYQTMLETGLRVGEATGLRWCDIDFEKNEISINHTLVYYDRGPSYGRCGFDINSPKTKSSNRIVPMTKALAKTLKELKDYQEENNLKCEMNIRNYTDFVFFNRFGRVYYQGMLNKTLRRIQRDCNLKLIEEAEKANKEPVLLPRFSCHTLRHTAATRLCEAGVNMRFIMDMLGHSDIRTTMNIYVDVTKELKVTELNKFEAYLNQ